MRTLMSVAVLLFAATGFAAENPQKEAIDEGVALFDRGKIDEAIVKYREALAADPQNIRATYELAMAFTAKSDFKQCQAVLEPVLAIAGPVRPRMLTALGNCFDAMGEGDQAINAYRKGLVDAPGDPQLSYNLAVALVGKKKLDEARELLKQDVSAVPAHANGHFALARVFEAQSFRVPALLEFFRYLVVAPTGRAAMAADEHALALLNAGIKQTDKGTNITVDPNSRKDEGDFSALEMMIGLASASTTISDEAVTKSEIEKLADQIGVVMAMMSEAGAGDHHFTAQTNIPFFNAMQKKEFVEPFVYVGFSSLELPGTREWIARNQAKVDAYLKWVGQGGIAPHPIEVPSAVPQP